MATTNKTPTEFSRRRKRPPFHQNITRRGIPDLHKISGHIVATDGGAPERIRRDHIFGVDYDSEAQEWAIFSYWNPAAEAGAQEEASKWAVKEWAARGKLERERKYTFNEFNDELKSIYPSIWIPSPRTFFGEFGLTYEADGTITNPRGLRGDSCKFKSTKERQRTMGEIGKMNLSQ